MVIKSVTQVGNEVIRARSKKVVRPKSATTRKVVKDLTDSMRHHGLVGMAAPQIGKGVRIFVTEVRKTKLRKGESIKNIDPLRVFINPRLLKVSKEKSKGWEGCGSVASAGLFGKVSRPRSVTVEAVDGKGKRVKLEATGLLARIIQHEMDHLNGIIFADKADTKTYMSRNEYLKLKHKKSSKQKS